jgi:lipoate-protein ligase A
VRAWRPELFVYEDATPHGASLNMAIDEALLGVIAGPVLRVYRWERPAVSFGYFQRWGPIRNGYPGRDAARRWTGGGVVLHGEDFTYSILIPRGADEPRLAAPASYRLIHGAVCSAMAEGGVRAMAAASSPKKVSGACFENPVLDDVVVDGRKVAGGAQRRVRQGLIHQGSIQTVRLGEGFAVAFAAQLAGRVERREFDILEAASRLDMEKYGTREWLEKFP